MCVLKHLVVPCAEFRPKVNETSNILGQLLGRVRKIIRRASRFLGKLSVQTDVLTHLRQVIRQLLNRQFAATKFHYPGKLFEERSVLEEPQQEECLRVLCKPLLDSIEIKFVELVQLVRTKIIDIRPNRIFEGAEFAQKRRGHLLPGHYTFRDFLRLAQFRENRDQGVQLGFSPRAGQPYGPDNRLKRNDDFLTRLDKTFRSRLQLSFDNGRPVFDLQFRRRLQCIFRDASEIINQLLYDVAGVPILVSRLREAVERQQLRMRIGTVLNRPRKTVIGRETIRIDLMQRLNVAVQFTTVLLEVSNDGIPLARHRRLGNTQSLLELRVKLVLLRLIGMKFKAERREPDTVEAFLDDIKRRLLLGHEEDAPPPRKVVSNDVGNRLRLARSGRTVKDKRLTKFRIKNCRQLRGIVADRTE